MYLRKFNHFIYVMLAVSLLASCKGLKQAEEFGKLHEKLETNFASLSNDIYLSCLRKASYPDEGYFPAIISFRSDEDKKCKEKFLPVSKKVNDANLTLINYVKGIGTLATNKPGLFRPNIDKLKTSLGTLNTSLPTIGVSSLDSSTIDSGFNLVNLLADIFTFNFRKKNVKTTVICSNKDIQAFVPALKKIVNVGYIPLLESEKRIVNLYFENHTPDSGVTNTLSDFIASHQLTESYNTALNKTIMRKIAAESYIKILDETADSHQKLTNIFLKKKSINDPKIEKKCKKFFEEGKELRKDKEKKTKQVSDELEIESLSKEEVEQVQQVLSQYYRKIKPLAKNINNAF